MKKKRLKKFLEFEIHAIRRFFDEIYFALSDTDITEPVVVSGSRLAFDSRAYSFEVYGTLDGKFVCQLIRGDPRILDKGAVLASIEHGFWQFGFVNPKLL